MAADLVFVCAVPRRWRAGQRGHRNLRGRRHRPACVAALPQFALVATARGWGAPPYAAPALRSAEPAGSRPLALARV